MRRACAAGLVLLLVGCAACSGRGNERDGAAAPDADGGQSPVADGATATDSHASSDVTGPGHSCARDSDCDNGRFCDGKELCEGARCVAGKAPCDDGVSCTADACDEVADTCGHTPSSCPATVKIVAAKEASAAWKAHPAFQCDGVQDETEVKQAIDAVNAAGGGLVLLSDKTFHLSSDLYLKANVILAGQGSAATTLEFASGRVYLEGAHGTQLRDFRMSGDGGVFVANSNHVLVKNILADTLGASAYGAFYIYANAAVVDDVTFDNCRALNCKRMGFFTAGEGTPRLIKNITYINCQAINSGRYGRGPCADSDFNCSSRWITGFDIAENADIEGFVLRGCLAEGSLESGFHMEDGPTKKNVRFQECISRNNCTKTEISDPWGCWFGAGFLVSGDVDLVNCVAEGNPQAGYAVGAPNADYTTGVRLYGCTDVGSKDSFELRDTGSINEHTMPVLVQDCASTNATRFGVTAANAQALTVTRLRVKGAAGDGSSANWLSLAGYPTLNSSFDMNVEGCGSEHDILIQNGQNITVSGTVRSAKATPVLVSGGTNVNTSRVTIVSP